MTGEIRKAAVAGKWYPASPEKLALEVDRYLASAQGSPSITNVAAIIAPHAGLMYSGPVAAYSYRELQRQSIQTLVLVGPSHFIDFEGVAIYPRGGFDTPLGVAEIDEEMAMELLAASPVVRESVGPHLREHSLEMQLPFVRRVVPNSKIVPLLIGRQTAETAERLGDAIVHVVKRHPNTVLIASTDLSHYEDSQTARRLDAVVIEEVQRFDPDGLQAALDANPAHACGGGAAVAVMRAARALGANDAAILNYGDSGDVSGDKSYVVGYLAAALSTR